MRGHKTEGQELFYSVEKDGQRQWYNRTAVILSLEQGNKLREQHSLGPYEPSTPLAKASDISLGKTTTAGHRQMPFVHVVLLKYQSGLLQLAFYNLDPELL